MEVVQHKMTHIDKLKGLQIGGSLAGIAEVFGPHGGSSKKTDDDPAAQTQFRFDWLSPWVHGACFPASLRDEIMGFGLPKNKSHVPACCRHGACPDAGKSHPHQDLNSTDIV
uniref:Uncharacterized protein n=1 Tax=Entomoneis paludosa TaxID=265537 RepID=A0A7S3DXR7_9STRA|mmetsp:Transcript_8466/g.17577  ORF Transcript_8466/g.17577 Transcript_8466/m.17577 type:complete len:112 (+) Transcript_8466:481-816(+)